MPPRGRQSGSPADRPPYRIALRTAGRRPRDHRGKGRQGRAAFTRLTTRTRRTLTAWTRATSPRSAAGSTVNTPAGTVPTAGVRAGHSDSSRTRCTAGVAVLLAIPELPHNESDRNNDDDGERTEQRNERSRGQIADDGTDSAHSDNGKPSKRPRTRVAEIQLLCQAKQRQTAETSTGSPYANSLICPGQPRYPVITRNVKRRIPEVSGFGVRGAGLYLL